MVALPVLDYSYIFSLKNHTYKKINLDITSAGAGPRSGHSGKQENKKIKKSRSKLDIMYN